MESSYRYTLAQAQRKGMSRNGPGFLLLALLILMPLICWAAAVQLWRGLAALLIAWACTVLMLAPAAVAPSHFEESLSTITISASCLLLGSIPLTLGLLLAALQSSDEAAALLLALDVAFVLLAALPTEVLGVPLRTWRWPCLLALIVHVAVVVWGVITQSVPWHAALAACWLVCVAVPVLMVYVQRRESLDRQRFELAVAKDGEPAKSTRSNRSTRSLRMSRNLSARHLSAYVSRRLSALQGTHARGPKAEVQIGTGLTKALDQLRLLRASLPDGTAVASEIATAVELLEASGGTTSFVHDLSTELRAANVDEVTGLWLQTTLTSQTALPLRRSSVESTSSAGLKALTRWASRGERTLASDMRCSSASSRHSANEPHDESNGAGKESRALDAAPAATALNLSQVVISGVRTLTEHVLSDWGGDVIALEALSNGHALTACGEMVFKKHGLLEHCKIDERTLRGFLLALEKDYGNNPYHSSVHAADVLMSVHLFLVKCVPQRKCTPIELLAAFLGAMCHDYRHPGTTNPHEVKIMSPLAFTYSDVSPLENHHLASTFALLSTDGCRVLGGLSVDEFRQVRSHMIAMVMHTDLSKHFDFIGRLKTLAATKGAQAAATAAAAAAREQRSRGSFGRLSSNRPSDTNRRGSNASLPDRRGSNASLPDEAELGEGKRRSATSLFPRRWSGSAFRMRAGSLTQSSLQLATIAAVSAAAASAEGEGGSSNATTPETPATADASPEAVQPSQTPPAIDVEPSQNSTAGVDAANRTSTHAHFADRVEAAPKWSTPFADAEAADTQMLLLTAMKFADLGHACKPWKLHQQWTQRITDEFWALGDREADLGVSVSPLCSRERDANVAKSQEGFFKFVCVPFYEVVADLVDGSSTGFYDRLRENRRQWQQADGERRQEEQRESEAANGKV